MMKTLKRAAFLARKEMRLRVLFLACASLAAGCAGSGQHGQDETVIENTRPQRESAPVQEPPIRDASDRF